MDDRLTDLEIRYSHLERQCADLGEVVFTQQKVLDAVQRELRALRLQVQSLGEASANEKPPHY